MKLWILLMAFTMLILLVSLRAAEPMPEHLEALQMQEISELISV